MNVFPLKLLSSDNSVASFYSFTQSRSYQVFPLTAHYVAGTIPIRRIRTSTPRSLCSKVWGLSGKGTATLTYFLFIHSSFWTIGQQASKLPQIHPKTSDLPNLSKSGLPHKMCLLSCPVLTRHSNRHQVLSQEAINRNCQSPGYIDDKWYLKQSWVLISS